MFYVALISIEMVVIVWYVSLQLPMQSVPITTNVVSSNPAQGEMYSIQDYVIKFVSDLRQVGGFVWVLHNPIPLISIWDEGVIGICTLFIVVMMAVKLFSGGYRRTPIEQTTFDSVHHIVLYPSPWSGIDLKA